MFSWLKNSLLSSKKPIMPDNNNCRKRNRLSKPPTNTSSLSLSSLSLLQPGSRSSKLFPLSTSTEDLQDQSPLISNDEPREILKARLFGPESEGSQAPPKHERNSSKVDVFVVNDAGTQYSISPTPKSPLASPLATMFSTSRLSLLSGKENKDVRRRSSPRTHSRLGDPSQEDLTAPIPIRRKSLRQPGIATRIEEDERWAPSPPAEDGIDANHDYYYNPVFAEKAAGSELEALNLESSRTSKPVKPPLVRTETPSDLVFLGGLKLGSLHVTNGRASPAPSDLSRRARARSTPNLRMASSELGHSDREEFDGHARAVIGDGRPNSPNMPRIPLRLTLQTSECESPLRVCGHDTLPKVMTVFEAVDQSLQAHKQMENLSMANCHPDRCTSMAEDYMAELPASPFVITRRSSSSQSILNPTSKATEFEDGLFEDDSVTPSDSESVGTSTVETYYSSNDVTPAQDKPDLSPQYSEPTDTLPDSGYSSNSSLRGALEVVDDVTAADIKVLRAPGAASHSPQNELKRRQDRRPGPRPLYPSILKHAGATTTSLPIFKNLLHSSITVCTVMTTTSTPPTHKAKKLTKLRLLSRSASSNDVTVQGNQEVFASSIPPIPAEFTANLAIRSRQVPELQHTFETRQHTAESPTNYSSELAEIRFPSPAPSIDRSDHESSAPPRPHARKESISRWRGSSKRRSSVRHSSHDISEADALAVIHDFGTVGYSLGGNPYDIARTNLESRSQKSVEPAHKMNPYNITSAVERPKSTGGMDAETAVGLARRRSRSIFERDSLSVAEKRNLFNDRGGLPGKNLRPMSLTANTPPLPSLPAGFGTHQKLDWAPQTTHSQSQQSNRWMSEYDQPNYHHNTDMQLGYLQSGSEHWQSPISTNNPGTPNHAAGYQYGYEQPENDRRQSWCSNRVEIDFDQRESWTQAHEENDFKRHYQNSSYNVDDRSWPRRPSTYRVPRQWNWSEAVEEVRPPPPPHSPPPMSTAPRAEEVDPWAAYSQAWHARRNSAGEALRSASYPYPIQEDERIGREIPFRDAPLSLEYHRACLDPTNASSDRSYNSYYAEPTDTYPEYPRPINPPPEPPYSWQHTQTSIQLQPPPPNHPPPPPPPPTKILH